MGNSNVQKRDDLNGKSQLFMGSQEDGINAKPKIVGGGETTGGSK
jgi:hypothetical protein